MKKVLFLAVNSRYTHSCLSMYYLRTMIKDLNYHCHISEKSINDQYSDICHEIFEFQPEILALAIYIWNKEIIEYILADIKKILPHLIIVAGGPEISYNAQHYTQNYQIDYLIKGSGEKAFYMLAEKGFSHHEQIINIPNYPFTEIPFPYQPEDCNQLKNKYIYYESSRGCPFKCAYCLSSRSDQTLEYKSAEQVKSELLSLIKFSPDIIKFVDRSFNVNKEFAKEIWQYLIDLSPKITFHFEIHPSFIDDSLINILKNAPNALFQFEIGVQSTHPDTLNAINRYSEWEYFSTQLKKLFELNNIHFHLDQIAGLPFETYSILQKSFNQIISLKPQHYQTGILKILYGTEMFEKKEHYEIQSSAKPPYQIFSTKWLSYEELREYTGIDHIVDSIYNSGNFTHFLKVLFNETVEIYQEFLFISQLFQKYHIQKNEKNNQKLFAIVAESIERSEINSQAKERRLDALRYDWALISPAHFYPEILKGDICEHFRQKAWAQIKEKRHHDHLIINNTIFSLSELRKARFFVALNQDFYQEVLLQNKPLADYSTLSDVKSTFIFQRNEQDFSSQIQGLIVINPQTVIAWQEKL
ncbi:MAG: DUF4080 domain-containing protein [Candidatus Cloacimonetes bacterium]|nr:DUF4080 domain-containing protein [Candidatus Cloacimonadota bacterium]